MSEQIRLPDGTMVPMDSAELDPSPADPFQVFDPFLLAPPEWLILGGLGDHYDAQIARKRWPKVKIIGIDPDPAVIAWQETHDWPEGAALVQAGLAERVKKGLATQGPICCMSLHSLRIEGIPISDLLAVNLTTLDALERDRGPFNCSILILDTEGYDYLALKGGQQLLASGRIQLVQIEVWYREEVESSNWVMFQLLGSLGYEFAVKHFRQWWGHNEVWRRKIGR